MNFFLFAHLIRLLHPVSFLVRVRNDNIFFLPSAQSFKGTDRINLNNNAHKYHYSTCQTHEIRTLREISETTFLAAFAADNNPEDMAIYVAESFSLEKISSEYENPESYFFFAELGEEIVGYLKLNRGNAQTEQKLENALEIERIYVLEGFYGKGIGQLFYNKAIEIALNGKFEYIWLGVWNENKRAMKFYRKNGFVEFATHTFKLGEDIQTDLLMMRKVKGLG